MPAIGGEAQAGAVAAADMRPPDRTNRMVQGAIKVGII
jgi:hypothetical protein